MGIKDHLDHMAAHTFMPTIASKTRSSWGNSHWVFCCSSAGTLSMSYVLYAMATQRKLLAAISSIDFLKNDTCNQRPVSLKQILLQCQDTINNNSCLLTWSKQTSLLFRFKVV